MRIRELLNLDCEDLNVKKRYVETEGKKKKRISRKGNTIYLDENN